MIARAASAALRSRQFDLPLYDLLRYHLGYLNADLLPERVDPGKRMRSKLCAYSCLAAGGALERAVPVAAAIELLHNFTLIHDDIQDRSLLRRHRPTIWARWGEAQAINAGDAMFVLSHLALNGLAGEGVDSGTILALSNALHLTTLRIVEGQTLDLGYEHRSDVTAGEYLEMIGGKTAAICRFAAWAGALVAGADEERVERFGEFGQALGIGFQLRDDMLGIWASAEATGKDAGDLRRRKKAYPVLLLFERAEAGERDRLKQLYARNELDDAAVAEVLRFLETHEVQDAAIGETRRWHASAGAALRRAAPQPPGDALLDGLLRQLAERSS